MLTKDIENLWKALKGLHHIFLKKHKKSGDYNCVDVEFLILNNANRDIVLLQCRPLNLIR